MYEPLRADGGRGASSTEVKSTAADESSNECQHCDGECKAATASRTRKRARSASADVEDNEDNHPLKKRCLLLSAQTVVAATGSCDASATTPACPQPTSSGSSSSACQEARATLCVNKRSVADFTSVVQHVGSHICLWLTGTELSRFSRLSKDCQDRVARLCADYQVSVREVWAPLHPILTPLCARTLVLAMEKLMRCSPGESSLVRRCEWLRDDAEIKLPVRSLFISAHAVGETPHLSARISKEAFGCVLRNVRRIVPRLLIARLLADKSGWIEEIGFDREALTAPSRRAPTPDGVGYVDDEALSTRQHNFHFFIDPVRVADHFELRWRLRCCSIKEPAPVCRDDMSLNH